MKKWLALFLILLSVDFVKAQENIQKYSLKQAVDYALQNKADVKNSLLDEEISHQKVNELIGFGTPQISGSADINNLIKSGQFFPSEFIGGTPGEYVGFTLGQVYTANAGISATQLLFDGSYIVGLQASRTFQELSRKQTNQTKVETVAEVSKAYYGVLVLKARMDQLQANIDRIKKTVDDTKVLNENGFVEKIDVNRIELTYNNLLVEKNKIDRFRVLSYALLKFQMGLSPKDSIELTDKLEDYTLNTEILPDTVDYNKRPDFEVLMVQHHMQELDLKRYRSTYLPSLVAFGSLSTTTYQNPVSEVFNTDKKWLPTAVVGIKLSVPIWDGLQKNSKIQQAKLSLQKMDNAVTNTKQGIQLDYISTRSKYENNVAALETTKKNRDLAQEISRVSKVKYDNGVGSSLEVTDAESSLRESDANYFNTLFEVIVSKIDLDKSMGTLTY